MATLDANAPFDMSEQADTAQPASAAPAPPPMKQKYTTRIEGKFLFLDWVDGKVDRFDVSELPPEVYADQAMIGVRASLMSSRNPAARFAEMLSGRLRHRGPSEPKAENPWKIAIAKAFVEEAKKADAPITLADAQKKASALDRGQLMQAKSHPVVVKHFHNPTGKPAAPPSLASLFGPAGSTQDPAPAPTATPPANGTTTRWGDVPMPQAAAPAPAMPLPGSPDALQKRRGRPRIGA